MSGIAQFFYSLSIAVNVYPGGYSITENFLSDLGRASTSSLSNNSASALVFNRSMIVLGITLMPFFAAMPAVLTRHSWTIRSSGLLSSVGLIGIGLTPYDQFFVEHYMALGLWLAPMLVMVIAFAASAELDHRVSVLLGFCTLSVILAAAAYAFAGNHGGHVIFQKVLAILCVCWFCLVFVLASVSTIKSIPSTRLIAERQARQYLKIIQRNHRR